ncbi:MAG: ABC transporter ATP-binding protein [Clostridium sp.]|nr:ABC transporter ATP-binding protein [Clostridium sp.]
MMLYINPVISVVAIVFSVLPIYIPKIYGKTLSNAMENYSDNLKKYNRKIADIFNGFEVIKSYSMNRYIYSLYNIGA